MDLIVNTVPDILAGDDDGGEAVGAGWMHLRVRARTKLRRGFVVSRPPPASPAIWSCPRARAGSPRVNLSLTASPSPVAPAWLTDR